jgi:predicted DsbA family dithiol-disulfide isomerase
MDVFASSPDLFDHNRFELALAHREDFSRVEDDNLDADAAGLPATPTLYVQGLRLKGPANSWYLIELLRRHLATE